MPRPYNYVGAIGQYKGVGTISQSELDATGMSEADWNSAVTQLNSVPSWGPNMLPEFNFGQVVGKNVTIGQWLQQNSTYLLIGGVIGLFLFRK